MTEQNPAFEKAERSFGKALPLDTDIYPHSLVSNQNPDADAGQ
jgi:hypothetical protein